MDPLPRGAGDDGYRGRSDSPLEAGLGKRSGRKPHWASPARPKGRPGPRQAADGGWVLMGRPQASCTTSPGLSPVHPISLHQPHTLRPVCPSAQPNLGWEGGGGRGPGFVSVWGGKRLAVPRRQSPRPGGPHASGHSRWARGPSSSWWPLAASCPITKQERRSASRAVPSRRLWSSVLASSIWIYRKPASPHGASCRVGEASRSPQFEQSSARLA